VHCSEPHELGFWLMMLSFTQKEHLSSFAGKRTCRKFPGGGSEQLAEPEPVGRRHTDGQMKVATWLFACSGASFECQKVTL
jgi:hypothetical protein